MCKKVIKMKVLKSSLIFSALLILTGCNNTIHDAHVSSAVNKSDEDILLESKQYSPEDYDYLAISNPETMSLASKRALVRNYHQHEEWFGRFEKHEITGDLGYEEGVIRRDPSQVLLIDGLYYTWYTKSTGTAVGFGTGDLNAKVFPWDLSEIWYATSKDGWHWEEQGQAVGLGEKGRYDDRSVFTPEILAHEGKYYLVYQSIKAPYLNRTKNTVAMAIADSPRGPWRVLDAPILEPADNGEWLGEEDSRFLVKKQGDFDSHKVHDPNLIYFRDKFYLYYKGERMGEKNTAGGREIRWGVAIADKPEGPYVKSPYNPITQSGHEICIWPYKEGIAMLSTDDGPERQTIQYAEDGINFEIRSYVSAHLLPKAKGLVKAFDNDAYPTAALQWGLHHEYTVPEGKSWLEGLNHIGRFSFSPTTKTKEFINKKD